MLNDFIITDKNSKAPLYRQIYMSVRGAIENGSLKKGTRLPSIRGLSADLEVSKTTVTAAYEQLCAEGYISSRPQSGYFVEAQFSSAPTAAGRKPSSGGSGGKRYFEYDFGGKSIDEGIMNLGEWKKYVKEVLNQSYLLTSYGEAQGEEVLRGALQRYSLGTRSVNASKENIVVGAGTQTLLHILCSLLGAGTKTAIESNSYEQSEYVFKSHGCEVCYLDCDRLGVTPESIEKIRPGAVLINPNFTASSGETMPITRRLEIIAAARRCGAVIIEDDYNGELRYCTRPMPCVQNYDPENTVYLGSFSKILLPSVRISYMALPPRLLEKYLKIKPYTNQTASKTEQLALAKYTANGKLDAHLRRARRIYLEKSRVMLACIKKYFGSETEIVFNETSLYLSLKLKNTRFNETAEKKIAAASVKLMRFDALEGLLSLSFSGIKTDKIESGIKILSEILEQNKIEN